MGSEVEAACAECSRKCLMIHRKHDPSLIVCSFFKVMYGKHFSNAVILPPRFAKLTSLVAQETYLEDSCGRKWDAILSDFDGSLAIQKGWNEFLVDHGIQVGDFVVFHYIIGSHFIVQIYGTHGCEKLSLSGENTYQNKRAKTTKCSNPTNACPVSELEIDDIRRQDEVNDVKEPVVVTGDASNKMKTTERPNIVPTPYFVDDTQFIINDQDHIAGEDDRDHLFDLSIFEMPKKSVDGNKSNMPKKSVDGSKTDKLQVQGYRCSQVFNALQKAEIRPVSNPNITKRCHVPEANMLSQNQEVFVSRKEYNPSGTRPGVGMPLSSNMPQRPVGIPSNSEVSATPGGRTSVLKQEPKVYSLDFISDAMAHASRGVIQQKPLSSNMPQKSVLAVQNSEFSAASDYCQPPGVKVGMVKQEPREFSQNFCSNANLTTCKETETNGGNLSENLHHTENADGDLGIIVKPEPVDLCEPSSATIAKITCSVQPDSDSFLVLPECLPLKACGQAVKFQPKVVLLQDPLRRVWPVLYHHKFCIKVLANGWKAFRDANNIQPGDECTFIVENMEESRFLVEILRGKRP